MGVMWWEMPAAWALRKALDPEFVKQVFSRVLLKCLAIREVNAENRKQTEAIYLHVVKYGGTQRHEVTVIGI